MITSIHHVGLQSPNPSAALTPYADFFGVDIQTENDEAWVSGANGRIRASKGLAPPRTASVHATGLAHVCIQAQDKAAARGRLERNGVVLLADPLPLGTGFRYSYARDREGRLIEMENAPFLRSEPQGWFGHVAFVTQDLPRLTRFYAALMDCQPSQGQRVANNENVDCVAQLHGLDLEPVWISGLNLTLEFWRYHAPLLDDPNERQCGYTYLALEANDPSQAKHLALDLGATDAPPEWVMGEACPSVLDPDGTRLVFVPTQATEACVGKLQDAKLIDHVLPARAAYMANKQRSKGLHV